MHSCFLLCYIVTLLSHFTKCNLRSLYNEAWQNEAVISMLVSNREPLHVRGKSTGSLKQRSVQDTATQADIIYTAYFHKAVLCTQKDIHI